MRGAVDAGSIVSFVAGLDEEEKSDVIYSVQLAQRAASAKQDRFAATKDWYGLYVDVLGKLGWAVEASPSPNMAPRRASSAWTVHARRDRDDRHRRAARDPVKTIHTLKKLGEGDRALRIFEIQAAKDLSGNFQIGAAQKADDAALSLALGAFHLETDDHRGKFLFFAWGAEEIRFWTGVSKMT